MTTPEDEFGLKTCLSCKWWCGYSKVTEATRNTYRADCRAGRPRMGSDARGMWPETLAGEFCSRYTEHPRYLRNVRVPK